MNSLKKRPRDSYDQADLQSHTLRLSERIVKHQLHNYGTALDLFDAVARTLIPYLEYNERYKIRATKQLRLETSTTANLAHHVRAQLQMIHVNEEKSAGTIPLHAIDVSNGAVSVYLENSPHGRTLQILCNALGLEIRLVTSYIYEEVISIIPNDLLEIAPLYIAFNDVSKQFFMLDRPANVKRDDLLQHQQTLDQLIQTHHLIAMPITKPNPRCLSLFHSIAQVFKSNTADFLDTSALAMQMRDATHQQLQSKIDFYEKFCSCDLRRDGSTLIESNYYRAQLEKAILHALAHVLQCHLIVFTSQVDQKPELIPQDGSMNNEPDQVIVLLKNESTQRFISARATYSLAHLFPSNEMDPVYETIDHPPVIDAKSKSNSGNTFFSKTKDKFVTVVNKLVDNYGNVPKKPSATASTKRPAPIAEHILRQQAQAASPAENTYENTKETLATTTTTTTTPGSARRSSTSSSSIVPPAKNSQSTTTTTTTSKSKQQLRAIPYKDRQTSLTRSNRTGLTSTTAMSTVQQQKIFNSVTVEDVDESTTADEATNNLDDDDSFSDEGIDPNQTVILRERKKKSTGTNHVTKKSTSYNYDQEALKRQQGQADEDLYENDRGRDDLNHDDDIYLSTADIVQQDRKQLQLFVNDRSSAKTTNPPVQERKFSSNKLLTNSGSANDRQSFLIDKDAVLEVLGHNIAQRDRHILMKVLKQEDLISKEWQRLLFLLDEYVNNPKKEKKERGLHALTLMENLDRLGYDMLEIQSTGPNHFKAIAKSILLIIEINDWFSEHICRVLHLNGPQDPRLSRHLRKLCLREWARYPDDYRALFAQRQAQTSQQTARVSLDLTREIERFRAEDYYRADMCALVNQALATALATPIHIVRAVREPNNTLEIYVPMRGIARPGLAIVLIASHPNAGDGHYDVAVLKGHPQTLRKHRNVTFDDKPEVRSFETNADEQQSQPMKVVPSAQPNPMLNPALIATQQAQFFPNQFLFSTFALPTNAQQLQQQQQPQSSQQGQNQVTNVPTQPQAPNSPSLTRTATSSNIPKTNSLPTTMILQPQMPFIPMPQVQPTFVYTPMMHTTQQQTTNPNGAATFFYTPANYPM